MVMFLQLQKPLSMEVSWALALTVGIQGLFLNRLIHIRGDIARLYLYFSVRYRGNGSCNSWAAMDNGAVLKTWAQTCYTNWHFTDPVSPKRDRS